MDHLGHASGTRHKLEACVGAGPGGAWNRTPAARYLVHAGPPGPARLPRGASPFPAASRAARSGSGVPKISVISGTGKR